MGLVLLLLLLLFSFVLGADQAALFKYKGPLYDVVFDEDPPETFVAAEVIEDEVDGRSYRCVVPRLEEPTKPAPVKEQAGQSPDLATMLAPLKGPQCLYRLESWWTYEFCHGASVKQFHADPVSGARLSEFVLGAFDSSSSVPALSEDGKTVVQRYIGGTVCDLTKKPRTVEVRFVCNDRENAATFVGELVEPSTCNYALTVTTPLVCVVTKKAVEKAHIHTVYCNLK